MGHPSASISASERWQSRADRVVEYSFHVLVFALPLAFYSDAAVRIFEFTKLRLLYTAAALILGGWAASVVMCRRLAIRRTPLDLPLVVYVLALAVSTVLSTDTPRSLWGRPASPGGALAPIAVCVALYFAYVANIRSAAKLWRNVWWLAAGSAVSAGYAVLQHFTLDWLNVDLAGPMTERAIGTIGAANPQGWYIALMFSITACLFLQTRGLIRGLVGAAWCLLVVGLLSTVSRSAYLGAVCGIALTVWALLWLRRTHAKLVLKPLVTLGLLACLSGALYLATSTAPAGFAGRLSAETFKFSSGERLVLWKDALTIWRGYPVWGSGPGTFGDQHKLIRSKELFPDALMVYNHAHNQYLQVLATSGATGLVAYLIVIGVFLVFVLRLLKSLRDEADPRGPPTAALWPVAMAGGLISILASQMFNPDFLPTNLLFYLLPAMAVCWGRLRAGSGTHEFELTIRPSVQLTAVAGIVLAVGIAVLFNLRMWNAHVSYQRGLDALRQNKLLQARGLIDFAVATNPSDANFWWVKAQTYASLAVAAKRGSPYLPPFASSEREAIAASNHSVQLDPLSEDVWRQRSICFRDLAEVDPPQLSVAVSAIEQATSRYPSNWLNYLLRARLEVQGGHADAAVQPLLRAAELAYPTDQVVVYAELAALHYRLHDRVAAGEAVDRFLKLGPLPRHWILVSHVLEAATTANDEPRRLALEAYLRTLPRPSR